MRHLSLTILSAILILTAADCRRANDVDSAAHDIADDTRQVIYRPIEASGFEITRIDDNTTLLTVIDPWQGAVGVKSQVAVTDLAGHRPAGLAESIPVITAGKSRLIAMSSTYVAMLEALDALDNLVGVSGMKFISSDAVDRHHVADVGNEADANYEQIVALKPDLVLIYGIASPSAMIPKLENLGIPYLYIGDYVEQSPLGRAEWIVALGELVGKRHEAINRFAGTRQRYNQIKATVDSTGNRPVVMLNAPYGDAWFIPPADSYMARLIGDAGGKYAGEANITGRSVALGDEEALAMASQADIWLCPGQYKSLTRLQADLPRFARLKPVKSGRVWNNTLRSTPGGGNDFYESGAINPDRILSDLAEIITPTDHDYSPYYFIRLK